MASALDMDNLRIEISMQSLSQHPNIVRYEETYLHAGKLWIVLEYMDGGPLTEVLGKGVDYSEANIAYVCRNMLHGIAYLHRHHRLHRDVKSDNILVDTSGNVKIGAHAAITRPAHSQTLTRTHSRRRPRVLQRTLALQSASPRRRTSARAWSARPIGWRPN